VNQKLIYNYILKIDKIKRNIKIKIYIYNIKKSIYEITNNWEKKLNKF